MSIPSRNMNRTDLQERILNALDSQESWLSLPEIIDALPIEKADDLTAAVCEALQSLLYNGEVFIALGNDSKATFSLRAPLEFKEE